MEVLELNVKAKQLDVPDYLWKYILKAQMVGSRAICDPPPIDTDLDILCLAASKTEKLMAKGALQLGGFVKGGSTDIASSFESFKLGELNIILTDNKEFFDKFVTAMKVCKLMNVKDKQMRIKIHHMIMGE